MSKNVCEIDRSYLQRWILWRLALLQLKQKKAEGIVLIAGFPFLWWRVARVKFSGTRQNIALRIRLRKLSDAYRVARYQRFYFGTREEELRWSSAATRDRVTIEWTSKTRMHVPLSARHCHETRAWWLIFGSRSIPASWHVQYSC